MGFRAWVRSGIERWRPVAWGQHRLDCEANFEDWARVHPGEFTEAVMIEADLVPDPRQRPGQSPKSE